MATKGTYPGVEPRGEKIRITFYYRGTRRRESLILKPTPANLRYASNLRSEIQEKIERGTFNYAEYFPDSKFVKKAGLLLAPSPTFKDLADEWLKVYPKIGDTTRIEYRHTLDYNYMEAFGGKRVKDITYRDIVTLLSSREFNTNKTFNNVLIPLRGLFQYAIKAKVITEDPTAEIEYLTLPDPEPDPFELDEVNAILESMFKRYHESIGNYFETAFFGGFRPSEEIALQWPNLDKRNRTIRVTSARVRKIDKGTKTDKWRDVELLDRAYEAIMRQQKFSFMQGKHIFLTPTQCKRWNRTDELVNAYFKPTLRLLKIRERDARQTRHTFATLCIMSGANPVWVSNQMGHKDTRMVFKVYSKWIAKADKSRQRNTVNEFISAPMPPQIAVVKD